jgi:hypothetical protein
VEGERARFADRFGAPLEQLRVPLDQPLGPERAGVLLVGGEREHEVAPRPDAVPGPLRDQGEQDGVGVLHVDGAAPPQHAVADLAGERMHRPVRRVRGHHVQVPVQQQRPSPGVSPSSGPGLSPSPGVSPSSGPGLSPSSGLSPDPVTPGAADPGHHVRAAGRGLQQDRLQARLRQPRGHVFGGRPLPGVTAAPVGGIDPDQVGGERRGQVCGGRRYVAEFGHDSGYDMGGRGNRSSVPVDIKVTRHLRFMHTDIRRDPKELTSCPRQPAFLPGN